jgi:hypothetical protein
MPFFPRMEESDAPLEDPSRNRIRSARLFRVARWRVEGLVKLSKS